MKERGFAGAALLPFRGGRQGAPWRSPPVQWLLFFTLFPLFMVTWAALAGSGLADVAYLFGVYFAVVQGAVIHMFLRPRRVDLVDVLRVGVFTAFAGIVFVSLAQRLPGLDLLYAAARGSNPGQRLFGFVFGVGLAEELTKAFPLWWIFVRGREPGNLREITFLGCVSGFAFGVAEAVSYSIGYAELLRSGEFGFEQYLVAQFTRLITLPLLHAVFSGIAGHFIGLGVERPHARRALFACAIAIPAVLHGFYNTFSSSILGLAVAVAAVLLFTGYARAGDAALEQLAPRPPDRPGS